MNFNMISIDFFRGIENEYVFFVVFTTYLDIVSERSKVQNEKSAETHL